jgi:hypothetical protein
MVDSPVPECDLVANGLIAGTARSWSMDRNGSFSPDQVAEPAIDRGSDGVLDGHEQ